MNSQKDTETSSCELTIRAIAGFCAHHHMVWGALYEYITVHDAGSDESAKALRRASAPSIRNSRSIEKNSSASSVALGSS